MNAAFILQALALSLIPFAFSLLLDICLGQPAAEEKFDRKAIFFFFSLWLAKRRLKITRQYEALVTDFKTALQSEDPVIKHTAKMNLRQVVFASGREYFSWELGFGMCPICTNIRIAIVAAVLFILFFAWNWWLLLLVPCFANMFMLIYQKLKF